MNFENCIIGQIFGFCNINHRNCKLDYIIICLLLSAAALSQGATEEQSIQQFAGSVKL